MTDDDTTDLEDAEFDRLIDEAVGVAQMRLEILRSPPPPIEMDRKHYRRTRGTKNAHLSRRRNTDD